MTSLESFQVVPKAVPDRGSWNGFGTRSGTAFQSGTIWNARLERVEYACKSVERIWNDFLERPIPFHTPAFLRTRGWVWKWNETPFQGGEA